MLKYSMLALYQGSWQRFFVSTINFCKREKRKRHNALVSLSIPQSSHCSVTQSPRITHLSALSTSRDLKDLQQAIYRGVDVLNNIRHLRIRTLPDNRNQRKILVNLPQQNRASTISKHNAALGVFASDLVFELLVVGGTFESLDVLLGAVPAVDLGDVDNDVNVVGADLVRGHVDGGGVGGDVDLGEDVEQVSFLESGLLAAVVEEGFEVGEVRDQFLDDLGEGFEDRVVVDRGQVEVDGVVFDAVVRELVLDALRDVALDVELVVIREAVNLVDENFDVDQGVGGCKVEDGGIKPIDSFEVIVLSVNDPDQSTNLTKDSICIEGRVHEVNLAGEVPNLEVHERAGFVS
jgi:hypothetical protein